MSDRNKTNRIIKIKEEEEEENEEKEDDLIIQQTKKPKYEQHNHDDKSVIGEEVVATVKNPSSSSLFFSSIQQQYANYNKNDKYPSKQTIHYNNDNDRISTVLKYKNNNNSNNNHNDNENGTSTNNNVVSYKQEVEEDDESLPPDMLLLHTACQNLTNVSELQRIFKKYKPLTSMLLRQKDNDGWNIFHNVCKYYKTIKVLRYFISLYPDGLQETIENNNNNAIDVNGYTPLHIACMYQRFLPMIQLLVLHNPNALQVQTINKGYTPLHVACMHQAFEPVVRYIHEKYPMALQQPELQYGWYPLHIVCQKPKSYENVIRYILKAYPEAAKIQDKNGHYPLHFAYQYHHSEVIIKLLFETYPLAVQENMNKKDTINTDTFCGNDKHILHLVCQQYESDSLIEYIVTKSPRAVQQQDDKGQYPLHIAYEYNQSEGALSLLLQTYPLAAQQKTLDGYYLLHRILRDNRIRSESLIQLIILSYPLAVQVSHGNYPLHLAYKYQHSEPTLKLLASHHPMAIEKRMKGGENLLHKICKSTNNEQQLYSSESFITFLIDTCPMAVQRKDVAGLYPLFYAYVSKKSESILKVLINTYPLALQERMKDTTGGGNRGGYLLHEICKDNNNDNKQYSESFVEYIIDTFPQALQETDDNGQYPLDIAYRYNQSESFIRLLISKYPSTGTVIV